MHVAVIGAGPLGLYYAARLRRGGADVTLVRRSGEVGAFSWHVTSRTTGMSFDVELPVALELPSGLDVIVVAVRAEQLTAELVGRVLAAGARAVVCLTPALGAQLDAARAVHPELVMAMPAVAAEVNGRNLDYWAAPALWGVGPFLGAPSTLVERRVENSALLDFVSLLRRAGIPVSYVEDAKQRTLANTVALFPLHVAIFLEPDFRRWLEAPQLLMECAAAMARARQLAARLGTVDMGLRAIGFWLSSAWRLRISVGLLVHLAPRLRAFLEHHFGPKLAAQHTVLQRDIEAMAREHGLPPPLPRRWVEALPKVG